MRSPIFWLYIKGMLTKLLLWILLAKESCEQFIYHNNWNGIKRS